MTDNAIQEFQPGQLRVIKREGHVVPFDSAKIAVAVGKACLAAEDGSGKSNRVKEVSERIAELVTGTFAKRMPAGGTVHIEEIQDYVELNMMRLCDHKVARGFVLHREEHARLREAKESEKATASDSPIKIQQPDGSTQPFDREALVERVALLCANEKDVVADDLVAAAQADMFDGMTAADVTTALMMAARAQIEQEPNYGKVAATLLLESMSADALDFLGVESTGTLADDYAAAFAAAIEKGAELELVSGELLRFDLDKLGAALRPSRDKQFDFHGLQTLYDRYFIHSDGIRIELPQVFFMRVAMGLAVQEDDRERRAIDFYNLLSSFDYMSSTPTLFNSGTTRPQLSSCFLTTVPDDLDSIFGAIHQNAMLSKWAGGLGNDWTPVRSLGSYIKGTNGKSQGVVPFLNVANAAAVAVNQGGRRKGAVCAYLETWHMDIEEFLDLRKNTGDDRRRTHDMNTANWVPDLFMKRVVGKDQWTLFSPSDVPDLHDMWGLRFEKRYAEYEAMAQRGEIPHKRVEAVELWRKMLNMLFETGHPWITFKDACNVRSPQRHAGVIHSSNLCTEITLNTSKDEVAVCNLGSVNLVRHIKNGKIDRTKLKRTVRTAVRMLDNVIDINLYAVNEARTANLRHRAVGLGIMGFHDALCELRIPYASQEAVEFADESMEAVSYYAIGASAKLARERGAYASFEGSLWSQGTLPIDSVQMLKNQRGEDFVLMNTDSTMPWDKLRERVRKGMRNSNVIAIAPTATIANIVGVSQSIEPTYSNLFVKSALSGEFTVVNPRMVRELKKLRLWDSVLVNDLKYYDGSLADVERVPEHIRALYATAFEIEPRWLIEAASRRQKWIDQSQSLNIYIAQPSGRKLETCYINAWKLGLKTTYYLRSMGATSTEKSTVAAGTLNAVDAQPAPQACSISDPDCEACQ